MTYLLDTCLVSELVVKQPSLDVTRWFESQPPKTLYLSVITMEEIAKGVGKLVSSKPKEKLQQWLDEDLPNQFADRILFSLTAGDIPSKLGLYISNSLTFWANVKS